MMGWLDKNKDGKLDAEEFKSMPAGFRDRLQAAGLNVDRPIDARELGERMSGAVQRMREGSTSRGGSGDRRGRESNDPQAAIRATGAFVMPERIKVLVALAADFKDLDLDEDKQISLFEWSQSGKTEVEFFDQDENEDGLLTPRELADAADEKADRSFKVEQRVIVLDSKSTTSPYSKTVVMASQMGKSAARDSRRKSADAGEERKAAYYFSVLDKNKDGKLSGEEWNGSRRVKPLFEKAKIPLNDMSKDKFIATYLKVSASEESSRRRR